MFNILWENIIEEAFQNEIEEYKKQNPKQRHISSLMCKNMFEQFENVKNTLEANSNLEHFISVYYTIGNYSPVPRNFARTQLRIVCYG